MILAKRRREEIQIYSNQIGQKCKTGERGKKAQILLAGPNPGPARRRLTEGGPVGPPPRRGRAWGAGAPLPWPVVHPFGRGGTLTAEEGGALEEITALPLNRPQLGYKRRGRPPPSQHTTHTPHLSIHYTFEHLSPSHTCFSLVLVLLELGELLGELVSLVDQVT